MIEIYSKRKHHKVEQFAIGDNVSIRIPRRDRASTDLRCIPCVVVAISGLNRHLYRLCTKHGVLKDCLSESELEHFSGKVDVGMGGWESDAHLSLRELAIRHNPKNAYYGNSCSCKSGCRSSWCSCKQVNKVCTKRYHSGLPCSNGSKKALEITDPPNEIIDLDNYQDNSDKP